MDIKENSKIKSRIPWISQSSAYEENTEAIKMANESFNRDKQISLENSFSDRESRIIKRSIKITEAAKNAEPYSSKRYQGTRELILNEMRLDEGEKYAVFDNTSEHSSD